MRKLLVVLLVMIALAVGSIPVYAVGPTITFTDLTTGQNVTQIPPTQMHFVVGHQYKMVAQFYTYTFNEIGMYATSYTGYGNWSNTQWTWYDSSGNFGHIMTVCLTPPTHNYIMCRKYGSGEFLLSLTKLEFTGTLTSVATCSPFTDGYSIANAWFKTAPPIITYNTPYYQYCKV